MKTPLSNGVALASLLLSLAGNASAQGPCAGWSLATELEGMLSRRAGTAVDGDRVAVHRYELGPPSTQLGSVEIHRMLGDRTGFVLEDRVRTAELGRGFAESVYGIALAGDSLLVAEKQFSALQARYIQLKKVGGVWVESISLASAPVGVLDYTRFDAAGGLAINAGYQGGQVIVDLLGVDWNGDWVIEDTIQISGVFLEYYIRDVGVRGDTAFLRVLGSTTEYWIWQRFTNGIWAQVPAPAGLQGQNVIEVAVEGDRLAASINVGGAGRLEVYDLQPVGTWTLTARHDFPATGGPNWNGLAELQLDGDQLAGVRDSYDVEVFEVMPNGTLMNTAVLHSSYTGELRWQGDLMTHSSSLTTRAMPRVDVVGTQTLCHTLGRPVCTDQGAGELRYEVQPGVDELVLVNAPPGDFAYALGSNDLVFASGSPSSLCVGSAGLTLRFPLVQRGTAQRHGALGHRAVRPAGLDGFPSLGARAVVRFSGHRPGAGRDGDE